MNHPLFEQLKFEPIEIENVLSSLQAHLEFTNGYTAFVFRAHSERLYPYEFAIIKNGKLCYDTPVTNKVIGHCNENDIENLLQKTKDLPKLEE